MTAAKAPRMRIVELWRYPVKSMLGESLAFVDIERRGVVGDRRYGIYDADGKIGSGKDTRRFRKIDGLFGFSAAYVDGVAVVRFPDGSSMPADNPLIDAALTDALGRPITLRREDSIPHLDARPLHLVSTNALAELSGRMGGTMVDARRFRPNIVVRVVGDMGSEDEWVGRTAIIGDVGLEIVDRTERCAMITFAQDELPAAPTLLRSVAQKSDKQFGVYAEVRETGRISRGDELIWTDASDG